MRTKIFKILFWLLLWFVTGAVVVGAILRSETFQRWGTTQITDYFSKELNTRVSIGRFDINHLTYLNIDSVFIGDRYQDTAFYIGRVTVDLDRLTWNFNGKDADKLNVNYIKVKDALVNFRKYNDTADFNYEFIIDYFDPPRDTADTSPPRSFILKVNKIELENTAFAYRNPVVDKMPPNTFNPDDFRFQNINGELDKFSLVDDSLAFTTPNLSVVEKNGFKVDKLKTQARIHSKGLEFYNLLLEAGSSTLKDELLMTYSSWDDLEDFIDVVRFNANLKQGEVHMRDVAFWSEGMENLNQVFTVSGKVQGTINNLKAKKVTITTGAESYLTGDFSIKGLHDFESSFIDAELDKSHTTISDLQNQLGIKGLSQNVRKLGGIDFTGNFTGFPKSFVAYGKFNTDLGAFSSDIKLDFTGKDGKPIYSGYLKSKGFDLGEFANEPKLLGNIALDAEIKGSGLEFETIDAQIKGDINTITFNNYQYKNITVDGIYAGKLFSGFARIRDKNVDLDFDGSVDFTDKLPQFDFVSTVRKANLDNLGIDSIPSSVTGKLYINFKGDKLDNLDGVLSVSEVEYKRETKLLRLDTAWLQSSYTDTIRNLNFTSTIADFNIRGQYNFSELGKAMYNYASTLLPQIVKKDSGLIAKENFKFTLDVKRPYLLTNFLFEEFRVDPFKATGSINTYTNNISLNASLEQFIYKDLSFEGIALNTSTTVNKQQKLALKVGHFYQGDSLYLENATAALTFDSSNVFFDIITPKTIARLSSHLRGKLLFSDTLYRLVFENSSVTSEKREWRISNNSFISYHPKTERTVVRNLEVSSYNEAILVNGAISKDINDTLRVDFDRFNIADVNYFTRPPTEQRLGGMLNGNVVLFNLFNTPLFTSDLKATKLSFGSDTLGNLNLQAHNENSDKEIALRGEFTGGLLEASKIRGTVNFEKNARQNFDIDFNLNNATTRFFEPFLKGVASGLKGSFTTTINIAGTFSEPKVTGNAQFNNPKFTIDYLQTTYSAKTINVSLNDDYIWVNQFTISDQKGVTAKAFGYINHKSFSNFNIDFKVVDMNKFMALNTKSTDNDLYFGTAYMTGDFEISGPFNDLFIEVKGKTEKGTEFNLQLADENAVSKYDFITFVNYSEEPDVREPIDLSGIRLHLDLEVTPDAEIKIIFDSQLGDIIEGNGYANLRMEINTLGDFKMFGNFQIEEGRYLFTALDFINKKFVIRKGGSIVWTGDPLNAQIDITAVYNAITGTQPLVMGVVPEEELINYKTPIPVEALMKLRGKLLKPEIKFGINIPDLTRLRGSDANTNVLLNAIRRIERDQEEVSRQVFSLLSLGTFTTPIDNGFVAGGAENGGSNAGLDAASNTVGNLLSNQITNWLSKYDPNWDIGIQVGQGGASARTEVMLTASRRWLNDRLQLDVSADNTSQGNINVNYKITPNGDNQVRVFGRNTNNPIYNQNILSFGGGFYFRKEFENFNDLRRQIIGRRIAVRDTVQNNLDSIPSSINFKRP